jgi:hypothetical protein
MRNTCRILVGKHERKDHLGDLGVEGRIILKFILNKWGMDRIRVIQDRF